MIAWALLLIGVALVILIMKTVDYDPGLPASLTGVVVGLVFVGLLAAGISTSIGAAENIKATKQQIVLYEGRAQVLTLAVKDVLKGYPAYEKSILRTFNARSTLLLLGQLRAADPLIEQVKQLVALQDSVYQLKSDLISQQRNLAAIRRNPFFPWTVGQ